MRKVRNCKHCGGTVTQSTDTMYLCENCETWWYRRGWGKVPNFT